MKRNKAGRSVFLAAVGFLFMCAGVLLAKRLSETEAVVKTLPYLFVGVGAGIFGGNLGVVFRSRAILKNPQVAKEVEQAVKQAEIEQKDERNQAISARAKARAYDLMLYVYGAVLLAFSVMQVDMHIMLTLVAVYLFFLGTNIYYLSKYHKEM